ncbi:MAG: CHAT domain-containing protein, partial [Actinomycetota bacterium]|nr:CHAT domain-containing protein [Actinomycetota bacterium]
MEEPAGDAVGAAPGRDGEDVLDLFGGAVEIVSAEPCHCEVQAGQAELAEAALLGRVGFVELHGALGVPFGVGVARPAGLLFLGDHDSDPLTVASLAPIRLDQARLAYLSACRTAFNPSTDLADEAIHLTTAFQLAGYPHVVGTFWEIDDALAVRIADTFYAALATGTTRSTPGAPRRHSTM